MPEDQSLLSRFDMRGRVAVVTGGGSGIGRATCAALAAQGCAVLVADLDLQNAQVTVDRLGAASSATAIAVDVTHPDGCTKVAEAAVERHGRLDVLVNSAGVYPSRPVLEIDEAHWDLIIDVNLKGTFFASQACARAMIASGNGGTIVNISSLRGTSPDKSTAVYSASKAGVISLTKSLAQGLSEHGIRVNAVAPGAIYTEATEQATRALMANSEKTVEEWQAEFSSRIPLNRFGQPDEVAQAITYLACDASSYITGSVLAIDGGGY